MTFGRPGGNLASMLTTRRGNVGGLAPDSLCTHTPQCPSMISCPREAATPRARDLAGAGRSKGTGRRALWRQIDHSGSSLQWNAAGVKLRSRIFA
jgi:hypothetical protein